MALMPPAIAITPPPEVPFSCLIALDYDQRPEDQEADSQAVEADPRGDPLQCRSRVTFRLRI
jgi:hypothetical protein